MKSTIITIVLLLTAFMAKAEVTEKVVSPDGRLEFVFTQSGKMSYTVTYDDKCIIAPSRLGVAVENKLLESALAVPNDDKCYRGEGWCDNAEFVNTTSVSKGEDFENWSLWKQKNKAQMKERISLEFRNSIKIENLLLNSIMNTMRWAKCRKLLIQQEI